MMRSKRDSQRQVLPQKNVSQWIRLWRHVSVDMSLPGTLDDRIEGHMSEWIPVSERLPEEHETVLVATDGVVSVGEVRFPFDDCGMDEPWWMLFKDRGNRVPITWACLVRLSDVTHWMPLPEPPEVK